ncbi:MAG: ATP-binding protein [Patescibacteria group bacterium]
MEVVVIGILSGTALLNALLLLLIYQWHKRTTFHRAFLVHVAATLGWTAAILVYLKTEWMFVGQLTFAFALILTVAKYYFVNVFPDEKEKPGLLFYLSLLPAAGLLILSFIPHMYYTEATVVNGAYMTSTPGPAALLYVIGIMFYLIAPSIHLWRKMRRPSHSKLVTRQLTILFYGMTVFFFIAFLTNSILPVVFEIYFFNGIGPVFSLILAAFIVHNIYRYKFLEIQTLLHRGFVYILLLALATLGYLSLVGFIGSILHQTLEVAVLIAGAITTIVGIVSAPALNTYIRRLTNRFFFKDSYDYQEALLLLSKAGHESLEMSSLLETSEQGLAAILQAEYVHIVRTINDKTTSDLEVPIKLKYEQVGVIVVGPKKSGDPYSDTDLTLLRTFARQTALAIGRVLLYQEVVQRAKELEDKVTERTQELQQIQQQQESMMLQLSHNLQTPLAVLRAKLQELRGFPDQEKVARGLERSVEELSGFIRDLLHYAQLESGQDTLHFASINLTSFLEEIIEEVETIAETKSVNVVTSVETELRVLADAQRLREAIMNICSNALKYMGSTQTKTLTITAAQKGDIVVMSFTDTGIGIDSDDLEHIFNHFYQAKNSVTGTGLGLSITRQIVEKHNGTITAQSTVSKGSTFTMTLPRHDS